MNAWVGAVSGKGAREENGQNKTMRPSQIPVAITTKKNADIPDLENEFKCEIEHSTVSGTVEASFAMTESGRPLRQPGGQLGSTIEDAAAERRSLAHGTFVWDIDYHYLCLEACSCCLLRLWSSYPQGDTWCRFIHDDRCGRTRTNLDHLVALELSPG